MQLNYNGRLDALDHVEEKVDVAIKNLSVNGIRVGLPRPVFESLIRALTLNRQGHRLRGDVWQCFAGLHVGPLDQVELRVWVDVQNLVKTICSSRLWVEQVRNVRLERPPRRV